MDDITIPGLSQKEITDGLVMAKESGRRRHPVLLHEPGDEFNRVFNFMMHDSYMQPHLHPGEEKIEKIYLVQGEVAVLFFDDDGSINDAKCLKQARRDYVSVPAFTWHTYVMLTEDAVTYETMMGKYDPKTWKKFADWAPRENTVESSSYLVSLKNNARILCN